MGLKGEMRVTDFLPDQFLLLPGSFLKSHRSHFILLLNFPYVVLSFNLEFVNALPSLNLAIDLLIYCCERSGLEYFNFLDKFWLLFCLFRDKVTDWYRSEIKTACFRVSCC